ncbi:MAG TPA: cell division protein ZapE [Deltaproteobacteria bacterium]|nr:cell division protein ZapE [Deltaproteobacteria bacterium]
MAHSRAPTELRHPGADRDCPRCKGTGTRIARSGEVAIAISCDCLSVCPSCRGTGLVAISNAFRARHRRCVCQVVMARRRAFDAAGIPARHSGSTRASFVPTGRHQTAVVGAVSNYLKEFNPEGDNRGLILYGDVGRGKTHLLVALLRELVFRHGVRARFVEFSHLLADLKSGFDVGRGMAALIDPLVDVEILAIDELGKGRNTEFEGTVLDELVSRRYNAVRPILATTNFSPGGGGAAVSNAAAVQVGTEERPGLATRVGPRVYSRLRETCDFVEVQGDDYREQRGRP